MYGIWAAVVIIVVITIAIIVYFFVHQRVGPTIKGSVLQTPIPPQTGPNPLTSAIII